MALADNNSNYGKAVTTTSTTTTTFDAERDGGKARHCHTTTFQLPSRVRQALSDRSKNHNNSSFKVILELGCGVGLTGLVAAAAFCSDARATILTDLSCVVDRVTKPNVLQNTVPASSSKNSANATRIISKNGAGGVVVAMPLCWGDVEDENAVERFMRQQLQATSRSKSQPCSNAQHITNGPFLKPKASVVSLGSYPRQLSSSDKRSIVDMFTCRGSNLVHSFFSQRKI